MQRVNLASRLDPPFQNPAVAVKMGVDIRESEIAWRIMLLALLGREVPELPCDVIFNACECRVLELLAKKKTA